MSNLAAKPLAGARFIESRPAEIDWIDAFPGERVAIRVHHSEVGGRYAIVDSISQPGTATPRHTHSEDEVFEVLEGNATLECDGVRMVAGPGTVIAVPAGIAHAWANFTDTPVHMRMTLTPGGFEDIFGKLPHLTPQETVELAKEFGTVVVGPPLARSDA
jgi:quercetin dioxygenase-like cupin family protein